MIFYNKDEDSSTKTLNDKNHQTSSQWKKTKKMTTIVWKPLMIKIIKLRLRNPDNWLPAQPVKTDKKLIKLERNNPCVWTIGWKWYLVMNQESALAMAMMHELLPSGVQMKLIKVIA